MNRLNPAIKIAPSFTAADWQLYAPHDILTGVATEMVVADLNKTLAKTVNKGLEREEVFRQMTRLMNHHARYGAADTDPRNFLSSTLNVIFEAKRQLGA